MDPVDAIAYGETGRYSIFGALVLFTTAMSATVAVAAISIATEAPLLVAVAAAALWGFGIFHIDRWLVSAHVDRPGIGHRLWLLIPRLVIAVPMGLLVAWFAMLGIADKEIKQQLDRDRVAAMGAMSAEVRTESDFARQRVDLVNEKTALEQRLATAEVRIGPLQRAYDEECAGTGGTRSKGCGPVAQQKQIELEAAKRERDTAKDALDTRRPAIEKAIADLDEKIAIRVAEVSRSTETNDGVFARRAALSKVLDRNGEARALFRLLEIVLVVVDVIPAVAKVVSPISMVDVARSVRRRRLREELEAAAAAERTSPAIADAMTYAAEQRATVLRSSADLHRSAASQLLQGRSHGVDPRRRARARRVGVYALVVAVLGVATLSASTVAGPAADRNGPVKQQTRLTVTVADSGDTELPLDGGGRVIVPAGAIDPNAVVSAVPAPDLLPGFAGHRPVGRRWDLHTEPAEAFRREVLLELPVPASTVDPVSPAVDYRIATFDEPSRTWMTYPGVYDASRNVVRARLPHFSIWQVWTWDWAAIGAGINQRVGELVRKRTGAAECKRGQPRPGWVADVVGVTNADAIAVRGCVEGEGDVLAVELVNNRPYGQVLTYGSAVKWGWVEPSDSPVDRGRDAFMQGIVGDRGLYIPPLKRASVGITRVAAGRNVQFPIQLTGWSLAADVLTLVAPEIVEFGAGALGRHFGLGVQKTAQLKECTKALLEPLSADDLKSVGAIHAFLTNNLLPCVEAAFVNLVREDIRLGALSSAQLERAQRILGELKRANRVGTYLRAYDLEWRLLDIFVDTKLVGGVTGIGNGFSVRARVQQPPITAPTPAAPRSTGPTRQPDPTGPVPPTTTTPPATDPPMTNPAPPPSSPPPTRGFTVADSFYGGTWARTGTSDGTWYPKASRPANARYWFPNGLGVAVDCVRAGAPYTVRFTDGRRETWTWWAHVTDNTWVPIAVFQEIWLDGPNGMGTC